PVPPSIVESAFRNLKISSLIVLCSVAKGPMFAHDAVVVRTGYGEAIRTNSRVFWYDGSSKHIVTAPTSATGTPQVATIPGDVTADGGWVGYSAGGILFSDTMSTIDRLPASGGLYQSLVSTDGVDSATFWATSTSLYFSGTTGTNFVALPTASTGLQLVTTSVASVLWSDDVDLYWTTFSATSTLLTCKIASCAATTKPLFTTNCYVNGIRGEPNAIYWGTAGGCIAPDSTNLDNLQIWKLAR
ncbi:MAG TPA: hypothetical protein VGP07_17115, partial [Polyangia bacterium]